MKLKIILQIALVFFGLGLADTGAAGGAAAGNFRASRFRVVAYVMGIPALETIPFKQLTHINYAFLLPKADGTFAPPGDGEKLKAMVAASHANQVKVLASIGGWGQGAAFAKAAANPQTRAVFVRESLKIVNQYQLDGVDIDWEYPAAGKSAKDFLALMQEMRSALGSGLLTAAVVESGGHARGIPDQVFALTDFLNVMTYDGSDHGSMNQFDGGLNYWRKRGLPPGKLVMGIPFYSRPGEINYRDLVENNPAAAQTDSVVYKGKLQHYNGIPTVKEKTKIALEKASGIMFWTLGGDAAGDASLVNAIHQTVVGDKR